MNATSPDSPGEDVMSAMCPTTRLTRLLLKRALVALLLCLPGTMSGALAQGLPGALGGPRFLPAEQAFAYFISLPAPGTVAVTWQIAPDYYMYQDKFAFSLLHNGNPVSSTPTLPQAVPHNDEYFGDVQVYFHEVTARLPLPTTDTSGQWTLLLEFQGCAEAGFCYTLQRREEVLPL
ncbi:MAG: protein-disulfide reductase DsbD N-terminal domain-containing protein [Pseudomonadales bacterium]|nr:protein-disulfide reductase DsbD N-terminal domain-containing protein [Pseudomonadales bacterium]